jgi:hypothetical protein
METCSSLLEPGIPEEISDHATRLALLIHDAAEFGTLDSLDHELTELADQVETLRRDETERARITREQEQTERMGQDHELYNTARRAIGLGPADPVTDHELEDRTSPRPHGSRPVHVNPIERGLGGLGRHHG